MALLIGICYLAHPLHRQIRTVFHEVSHFLEAPGTVLSHPPHEHSHNHEHSQDHGHSQDHVVHKVHQHGVPEADHDHRLLDLVASLFDTENEQYPDDDTLLVLTKWDKHIGPQDYPLPQISLIKNFPYYYRLDPKNQIWLFRSA